MRRSALLVLTLLLWGTAAAHEIRPASLEISELETGWEFRFRQPVSGEYTIALRPVLASGWLDGEPTSRIVTENSLIRIWRVENPPQALAGQELRIGGLDRTITDTLVRIHYRNGNLHTQLIKAAAPVMTLPASGASSAVSAYFLLGIEHIWSGPDHLLYVLALLLLITALRPLLFTITAFTLAHSITLAAAALNLVHLRTAPVEAVIALSIVYVAAELVRSAQGRPTLASRAPWLIAFAFGLLHGFGFAGALQEIGLPPQAVAPALLLFNLGIEAGQLLFVSGVLSALWLLHKALPRANALLLRTAPYGIGSIAAFWLLQRLLLIVQ